MANSVSHAALPYPIKGARYTIQVPYLDADGDPTDPTTPDTEVSQDGGAFADATEEVTTITGSNGCGYITLTGAEMNNSTVTAAFKVASGPKATLATLYPRVLAEVGTGTLSAGSAGGGTLGTLLAYDVTGCFIKTTGGAGGGGVGGANNQVRKIVTYNTGSGAFTVTPNWETTPDATTTYAVLLPEGVTLGMLKTLNPTTAGRTLTVESDGMAHADLKEWLGTAPLALSSQRVQSHPGGGDGDVITSTLLAASAVTEIQSGLATAAALDAVDNFIDTEIADIQARLPAALVGGRMDSNMGAISTDTTAADNLEAAYDGTGYAHTGNTYPWTPAWDAEVESECNDALVGQNLDHLVKIVVDTNFATTVHLDSVIGHLADGGTTATFDRTTDSLEALQAEHDATQSALTTIDDFLDTEVAAILAAVDTEVAAIVSAIGTPGNLGGGATLAFNLSDIEGQTDDIGPAGAGLTAIPFTSAWFTTALTEAYRSTGATGSVAQLLYEIIAHMGESAISGTTKTLKKLDGSTTAKTYTIDSSSVPTSITETT